MKKNNKGFSLVELIVVVLIMAIIAVALAPQVMKWVENSRKSTDCNNYDSVVSAVNIALANEDVMKNLPEGGTVLYWGSSTATATGDGWTGGYTQLNDGIATVLGTNWATDLKVKRTTDLPSGKSWSITVDGNGTVSRSEAPSANSIS